MKQEKIIISTGKIRKNNMVIPTAEVVYITTNENTGKKTSMTKHEIYGAGEAAHVEEPVTEKPNEVN